MAPNARPQSLVVVDAASSAAKDALLEMLDKQADTDGLKNVDG